MRDILIYAKYLIRGDVFREARERPSGPNIALEPHLTVLAIEEVAGDDIEGCCPTAEMQIRTAEGLMSLKEGAVVELLHRPYPKGETRETMLAKGEAFVSDSEDGTVTVTIHKRGTLRERLAQVREGIEAYELGLPIDRR